MSSLMNYVYVCCGNRYDEYRRCSIHIHMHFDYGQNRNLIEYICQDNECKEIARRTNGRLRKYTNYASAIAHVKNHFTGIERLRQIQREQAPLVLRSENLLSGQSAASSQILQDSNLIDFNPPENEEDGEDGEVEEENEENEENEDESDDDEEEPYNSFDNLVYEFALNLIHLRNSVRVSEVDFIKLLEPIFKFGYEIGATYQLQEGEFKTLNKLIKSVYLRNKFSERQMNIPAYIVTHPKVCYYSIRNVASLLFQNSHVIEMLDKDFDMQTEENYFNCYRQTSTCLIDTTCFNIRLELYADDFPIPQSGNKSILAFYYTFNNFPFYKVTKRSQIYPLLFAERQEVFGGMQEILQPFIEEMQALF